MSLDSSKYRRRGTKGLGRCLTARSVSGSDDILIDGRSGDEPRSSDEGQQQVAYHVGPHG